MSHPPETSISPTRTWVLAGAFYLAGIAGFVNVTLLDFFHVPVSHMSGATSRLSIDLGRGNFSDLALVALIVIAFFCGCVLTGMIIGDQNLMLGRRYGVVLMLEGGILGLSALALTRANSGCVPLAALACGMQNAMASNYYGLVIRTTHVSGVVTDLGFKLGHMLRSRRLNIGEIIPLAVILCAFFSGGLLAALLFSWGHRSGLMVAAASLSVSGVLYFIWRHNRQ